MKHIILYFKMRKQELGQYYTTNYQQILSGLTIPPKINKIIEPFVGQGHLLTYIEEQKFTGEIIFFDLDPHIDGTIKQDTLRNPPDYRGSFVITNPPFLARNKNKNKDIYDKYGHNDYYKCFLMTILSSVGGILILPLNFLSSERKKDRELRDHFFQRFEIVRLNIFKDPVFEDTSSSICSFQYQANPLNPSQEKRTLETFIYGKETIEEKIFTISRKYGWMIGGEIHDLPINPHIKIARLLEDDPRPPTRIKLIALDEKNGKKIRLQISEQPYVGKASSRTYATLIISPPIDDEEGLVEKFNSFLEEKRKEYHSLFLSTYREFDRKRIPFTLAYRIINYLLSS